MNPKFFQDDDVWMLGEDIPNADLFFSNIWLKGFVSFLDKNVGKAYKKILCKYEGYHLWFYFGEKDSFDVAEHIAERIVHEPNYAIEVNKNIIIEADKLRNFSNTIPQTDLQKLSNEELWKIYETHYFIHSEYYTWTWIPAAVDMFHNNLTKRIKEYLLSVGVDEKNLNEYFITLTQPTEKSLIFIEQEDLLKIVQEIQKDPHAVELLKNTSISNCFDQLSSSLQTLITEHWNKYYYTKHLWVSGEYTIEEYLAQIKDILCGSEPASIILEKQYQELEKSKQKRLELIDRLNVTGQWRIVLDQFGAFMVTKIYRRYAQLLAVHHMSPILKEIAKRKFLTEKQVRFLRVPEMKELLLNDIYNEQELLERTQMCVYYAEKDFEHVMIGEDAREHMKPLEKEIDTNITEFKGESACVGYAKGVVKIIIRAEDMIKMNEGDILVSIATDPDIVPAMKKAAGIVTEQGGVTSHAAIVSRELGIPCVIGTKIATRVLKDGDMVEVDANRGMVKKVS